MSHQKNPGGRPQQKQDKSAVEQPSRDPMSTPAGEDIERDRSSNRDKGDVDSGSVIENDEEVELDDKDLEDEESNKVTGRHPSQRDR